MSEKIGVVSSVLINAVVNENRMSPNSMRYLLCFLESNSKTDTGLEVRSLLVEAHGRSHVQREVLRNLKDRARAQEMSTVLRPVGRIQSEVFNVDRRAVDDLVSGAHPGRGLRELATGGG